MLLKMIEVPSFGLRSPTRSLRIRTHQLSPTMIQVSKNKNKIYIKKEKKERGGKRRKEEEREQKRRRKEETYSVMHSSKDLRSSPSDSATVNDD